MPKVSEFFGISVYLYWYDDTRHKLPHFHALFGGHMAVFDLDGKCIAGDIGKRAARLVREWAHERKPELTSAWKRAIQGRDIPWIKPIR